MKTVGVLAQTPPSRRALVDWMFTFGAAAYNLVRWRNLVAQRA